jgi:multidrug resistance protein
VSGQPFSQLFNFLLSGSNRGKLIYYPKASLSQVTSDLHTTPTITNLSVAIYMLSMAIFPLWWSAFSDSTGRRTVYLVSMGLGVLFAILAAIAKSISVLIVMRLLSGGASASVQAVGAGTIADLWDPRERGRAMGIFMAGPQLGPLVAPIVGALLANRWSWRSTMWFMVILTGAMVVVLFLLLPETLAHRRPVLQEAEKSQASHQRQVRSPVRHLIVAKTMFLDPLKIMLNLRFPAVILTVYYSSISFLFLYVMNISLEESFPKPPYNFSIIPVGLVYIPNSLGYIVASILGGRWMDYIMKREAIKANRYDENGKLIFLPEDRMRENAWLGGLVYPAAMIWYGWTVEKGVFWLVPVCCHRNNVEILR